ncbi:uncharacterized protein LOC110035947 isoform X2 [Phalaenopsis equestris]|uniref:uncharacterized protein LOC110035947 isoform X2 n=1 Tax=Phalaenopsis equestris TaxID=78828 RepID=UPI0009E21B4A|nr:uncharacterized protein LOC110035947 isoform X2 [Phalaenopsis equestris]
MNTRARIAENGLREVPKHDKMEEKKMVAVDRSTETNSRNGPKRCLWRREKKIALEQAVDKLRKKLRHEENVHRALERAFTRPLGALPRLPSYLPSYTIELLAEVAVLEEEVARLEDKVINFRKNLYEEAIYISSSQKAMQNGFDLTINGFPSSKTRNSEHTKAHSPLIHPSASAISNLTPCFNRFTNGKQLPKKFIFSLDEDHMGKENQSNKLPAGNLAQSPIKNASRIPISETVDREIMARGNHGCLNRMACEEATGANKLSEEILRCLIRIFARLGSPKNTSAAGNEMCPSVSGSCDTYYEELGFRDPYNVCKQFGRRDIGPYKLLREVDSGSSEVNCISKLSFLTRGLKLLFRKLSSVDISELIHQEKLAFWMNIYNSCMMNAYIENGIPSTPEMVLALMLKAKVNVGGHLFTAMTIEHLVLRIPYNSKHISPKGFKSSEVTRSSLFGLDWPEPLVTFALSCGSWSSPAYR